MGHQRLGKLPTHRYLPDIVRYLVTGGTPTAPLVEQITEVGRDALKRALKDPVFVEALWMLIRLPQAAASKDFGTALAEIGMGAQRPTSVAELMIAFDKALERVQRREHRDSTDLGEIARQAALTALGDAVRAGMPMWSPTADDVHASAAALRSPEKFGALAHHFHANTVVRVIHYYVDRNLHEFVGADRVVSSVHDLATYDSAIRRHCMEAALIMHAFARDWLGKNQYRDGKDISGNDARNFSAYAVEKISIELKNRKGVGCRRELTQRQSELSLRTDPCGTLPLTGFVGGYRSDRHGIFERHSTLGDTRQDVHPRDRAADRAVSQHHQEVSAGGGR